MKILEAGHVYELNVLDDWGVECLRFVKREGANYPGNIGHHAGTTSQEVLRALINRAEYVNAQIPCWQTRLGILLMGVTIWLFEHRAAKRHNRKVPGLYESIYGETCKTCGHVGCERPTPAPKERANDSSEA
jgi:hypothetical protein